jgi:putative transposase
MLIRKAYKFRLAPDKEQSINLAQGAGCVRLVWNKALKIQKDKLDKNEKVHTYNELAGFLTTWKKSDELLFLSKAHSQPLQQTLKDLDRALKDGFKKAKAMPRFKKKNCGQDGLRFPQGFSFKGKKLFIPKIGEVKTYMGRPVSGKMKNLTVVKEAGLWYAAIQVEEEIAVQDHPNATSIVGIDLGIKKLATLSNGKIIEPISPYRKYEKKLADEQVRLARKKKGSENKESSKRRLQNLHEKIRRIRQDYLHKASDWITKNHGVIVLEDLKISSMSASAKGTLEEPGCNVKAKSGLNKSILDQGWYEFKRQISYKSKWRGGVLHLVAPHYTSQECSACHHVSAENRKTQSEFVCVSCGFECNADENAAKNIEMKALGHGVLACESNLTRGRKQEPLKKRKVQKIISEYQSLAGSC